MNKNYNECPICNHKSEILLELNCGNPDKSSLNQVAKISSCTNCGHIFNQLTEDEILGLYEYYNEEYSKVNQNSPDKSADRPGTKNECTTQRNIQLYEISKKILDKKHKILDIGCANGEFLKMLHSKGFNELFGIDLAQSYVEFAKKNTKFNIQLGSALDIPFNENKFDVLYMDQVLEHLVDPNKAFLEAKRVLKENGYFCISVPNAKSYNENYVFDFFWFLQREHINHFDINHIELLANLNDFELVSYQTQNTPMNDAQNERERESGMMFPNLSAVFKLKNKVKSFSFKEEFFELKTYMQKYIKNEFKRLQEKKTIVDNLKKSKDEIYIWGASREFFYLLENTNLSKCNITQILDANIFKQKNLTIKNIQIKSPKILTNHNTANKILLITAALYSHKIKQVAINYNFKGNILAL